MQPDERESAIFSIGSPGRDEIGDRRAEFLAGLDAVDHEAARLFYEADQAAASGDHAAAARLYEEVQNRVPAFAEAHRLQCDEELALGRRMMAIAACRNAVDRQASPLNLAALARALITPSENFPVRPTERLEATSAALRAADTAREKAVAATEERFALAVLCEVGVVTGNTGLLRDGVERLESRFAGTLDALHYRVLLSASRWRYGEARQRLRRARESGLLTEEVYRSYLATLRRQRPIPSYVTPFLLPVGGTWLGFLPVLLGSGLLLSRLTLRAARREPAGPEGAVTGFDALLRRLYRAVLWLCCGYFYASMPCLILTVLVFGGGALYVLHWLGFAPVGLIVSVALVTVFTLIAIVQSLLVRAVDEEPGRRLPLGRYPALRGVLEEVASRVGTRAVDVVYITPGVELAVFERGGTLLARARGRAERCLIVGIGALDGLRLGPFRAILAHEYGHFSNRDTAGGGLALVVRRSSAAMVLQMAACGAAAWYNPAWHFAVGFYKVFLRISQGASRLQEVLADRWAALAYGSGAFEEGLRHIVERAVRFDSHLGAAVGDVLDAQPPPVNLYRHRPSKPPIERGVAVSVQEALAQPATPYDSHPSTTERIARVRALGAAGTGGSATGDQDAWSLLPDRTELEQEMTAVITAGMLRGGERAPEGVARATPAGGIPLDNPLPSP